MSKASEAENIGLNNTMGQRTVPRDAKTNKTVGCNMKYDGAYYQGPKCQLFTFQ